MKSKTGPRFFLETFASALGSCFKDSQGRIVLAQFPNWPLWLAIFFWVAQRFLLPIEVQPWFQIGFVASLLVWAVWEILDGVNCWRRLLGLFVTGWVVLQNFPVW